MSFYIYPHETLDSGLKRIALERLAQSIEKLTHMPNGRTKAVHDTRKNFKRVRAVLRLMRDALGNELFQEQNAFFRDASRLLAPIRDSEVMVQTLAVVDPKTAEFGAIRQALVARHEVITQQLLDEQQVLTQVVTQIENGRSALEALRIAPNQFDTIAPSLQRVYARGRKRMALAYNNADEPELFHDWRKRVKYLWYHLEILRPVWPSLYTTLIDDLHQVSDYLGDAHDMAELCHVLQAEPEQFAAADNVPLLLQRLQAEQQVLNQKAISLGTRLYVEEPACFMARLAAYWQAWREDVAAERPFILQPVVPVSKKKKELKLLSTRDVATELGQPIRAVRQLIRNGRLPAKKVGQQWVIEQSALAALPPKA